MCCGLWRQAKHSRRKGSTNCSTKSVRRSANSLTSWHFRRKEVGNGNDKVGTQGIHHLAAAQPPLHVRHGIHGGHSDRTVCLLPVHLRQRPTTAVLYADLRPVQCCGSDWSEPQRQL